MSDTGRPLRLAVVGVGAVAEMRYLPAAARMPGVDVTHVVDLDADRARAVASEHGIESAETDVAAVLEHVDAAIVATPPSSHASIAIDCLNAGVHVLCEKPMTATTEDAERIVETAESSAALFSVAMVRRVGTGVRVLKEFLDRGLLGRMHTVDAEEGGEFNWPLRTGHIFESRDEGGVLRDTGTHIIDLVLWVSAGAGTALTSYEDDSWGGAEANAFAAFTFESSGHRVESAVEVSFTRGLRNSLRVHGDTGWMEAPTSGGTEAVFHPAGASTPIHLHPSGAVAGSRTDDFVRQLEEFEAAIRAGGPPPVSAREALETVRLIDTCYASRTMTIKPWEEEPSAAVRS